MGHFLFSSKMPLHFIKLQLGNKKYKDQVSTEGCTYVADFKSAIKKKLSPDLDSYAPHHIILCQPDGITEIDPETLVTDLAEIPWKPMVVTVDELPIPASIGSTKKQLTYKGMSTEASCRKYFDALANEIYVEYDFPKTYRKPTLGDVLAAKDGQFGKPKEKAKGIAWWDYRKENEIQLTNTPLPELFDEDEWKRMKELNRITNERIHDARLPTDKGKVFIVLPNDEFNDETVRFFKRIGKKGKLFTYENDLIVKDESGISGSSSSEASTSPDKEKKL
jgi:hypothetical protein